MNINEPNKGAGKGDKPRNCFSDRFKKNYDKIKWKNQNHKSLIKKELKNKDGSATYIYK
jgi:hypothetical protein